MFKTREDVLKAVCQERSKILKGHERGFYGKKARDEKMAELWAWMRSELANFS